MSFTAFLKNYVLEGELLEVFTYPDPVLTKKTDPLVVFDKTLEVLAKNMLYTMYKKPGVGLAAPQVGKSLRMFVMDVDYKREKITRSDGTEDYELSEFNPLVIINPVLKDMEGEIIWEEGCLSVPGIYENVKRANKLTLEYLDLDGKPQTLEAEELRAVCVQHETDHLDGIVFLERLSLLKKKFAKKKYLKERENAQ